MSRSYDNVVLSTPRARSRISLHDVRRSIEGGKRIFAASEAYGSDAEIADRRDIIECAINDMIDETVWHQKRNSD